MLNFSLGFYTKFNIFGAENVDECTLKMLKNGHNEWRIFQHYFELRGTFQHQFGALFVIFNKKRRNVAKKSKKFLIFRPIFNQHQLFVNVCVEFVARNSFFLNFNRIFYDFWVRDTVNSGVFRCFSIKNAKRPGKSPTSRLVAFYSARKESIYTHSNTSRRSVADWHRPPPLRHSSPARNRR